MINTEIDLESIKLCTKIKKAINIINDSVRKYQCTIIVLQSLKPQFIETILLNRLLHYKTTIKDIKVVQLNHLTTNDLQKNQLIIVAAKYNQSLKNLRYLYRDILVINFVYGNILDCTYSSLDFIAKNIREEEQ